MSKRMQLVDAGIALVVLALAVGLMASGRFGPDDGDARSLDALGVVLAIGASLPLVVRRRAPLVTFAVVTAATGALYALDYSLGPPAGCVLGIFTVASTRQEARRAIRRAGVVVLALLAGLLAAHAARNGSPGPELLLGVLVLGGAWVAGDQARLRRERMAALEERARRAERDAERERALAAAEERTRIARDLHDSAGHAINVILVQAGAARLLQERDPERSRRALETIEDVARETIGEIERLVRVLRDDAGGDGSVEPPPGLAALEGLVERHRSAGLDVALAIRGPRSAAPAGVERAAFRIVQEALTNAARHGAGGADVRRDLDGDALRIAVANPAPAAAVGDGHGLVGMRERAALLGGAVDVDAEDGVFRIRARLPYREAGR